MRARGGPSETRYAHLLGGHRRLIESLQTLVEAGARA
jgi:hypothetical protein